jgi:hypothetical protein
MKPRKPQLKLRLDAATPDAEAPWRAGGEVVYRGGLLKLVLDTTCRLPERAGDELHLPLPPAATPRQIRDAAESWLRDEAQRLFSAIVEKSALAGRPGAPMLSAPRIVLAFGKRGDWARRDGGEGELLRCHWRLIEQADATIEQVLRRAMAAGTPVPLCDDLFACA